MLATSRDTRRAWQHLGLSAGFIAGRHFLGLTDLHFGYWSDRLTPCIHNLKAAQEEYSAFVLEHIPVNATRLLDVGSGAGGFARRLLSQSGRRVDCVSPCQSLNGEAQQVLGNHGRMFECRYEDLDVDASTYDAVVFCESFQYVNMKVSLHQAARHLRIGGTLLICDFFRKPVEGKSPIGGGHKFDVFWDTISQHPFVLLDQIDITERTAPTFDVINQVFDQVLRPIWTETHEALVATHPVWTRLLGLCFGTRIEKAKGKYFKGVRTSKSFKTFKTYQLLRFQRC